MSKVCANFKGVVHKRETNCDISSALQPRSKGCSDETLSTAEIVEVPHRCAGSISKQRSFGRAGKDHTVSGASLWGTA